MARTSVRDLWKAKLEGKPVPGARALRLDPTGGMASVRLPFVGKILGIDPSLRGTGLALIEFGSNRTPILLRTRTVKVPANRTLAQALAEIHHAVVEFVHGADVKHVALEQTIYVQNFQTAQILGAARGAAIAAAAIHSLPIFEYPPLRVKLAVVGAGRASKEQMARTVMALLGHASALAFDEADAAGVAICHAFTWRE